MFQLEGRIGEENPLKEGLYRILRDKMHFHFLISSLKMGEKQELILKASFCYRLVNTLLGALVIKAFILKC